MRGRKVAKHFGQKVSLSDFLPPRIMSRRLALLAPLKDQLCPPVCGSGLWVLGSGLWALSSALQMFLLRKNRLCKKRRLQWLKRYAFAAWPSHLKAPRRRTCFRGILDKFVKLLSYGNMCFTKRAKPLQLRSWQSRRKGLTGWNINRRPTASWTAASKCNSLTKLSWNYCA